MTKEPRRHEIQTDESGAPASGTVLSERPAFRFQAIGRSAFRARNGPTPIGTRSAPGRSRSRLLTRCLIIRSLSGAKNLIGQTRMARTQQKPRVLWRLLFDSGAARNRSCLFREAGPQALVLLVLTAIIHRDVFTGAIAQEINPPLGPYVHLADGDFADSSTFSTNTPLVTTSY